MLGLRLYPELSLGEQNSIIKNVNLEISQSTSVDQTFSRKTIHLELVVAPLRDTLAFIPLIMHAKLLGYISTTVLIKPSKVSNDQ